MGNEKNGERERRATNDVADLNREARKDRVKERVAEVGGGGGWLPISRALLTNMYFA